MSDRTAKRAGRVDDHLTYQLKNCLAARAAAAARVVTYDRGMGRGQLSPSPLPAPMSRQHQWADKHSLHCTCSLASPWNSADDALDMSLDGSGQERAGVLRDQRETAGGFGRASQRAPFATILPAREQVTRVGARCVVHQRACRHRRGHGHPPTRESARSVAVR
jgi:hypothetical protein